MTCQLWMLSVEVVGVLVVLSYHE